MHMSSKATQLLNALGNSSGKDNVIWIIPPLTPEGSASVYIFANEVTRQRPTMSTQEVKGNLPTDLEPEGLVLILDRAPTSIEAEAAFNNQTWLPLTIPGAKGQLTATFYATYADYGSEHTYLSGVLKVANMRYAAYLELWPPLQDKPSDYKVVVTFNDPVPDTN
jgi:hypothetical protein